MSRWTWLLLLAMILPARAGAQDITISADVDRNNVPLNAQINLQVTVSGSAMNLPEPQLPSMPNFSVYSAGRSQNVAIMNGHVSGAVVYSYTLVPRFVGNTRIGPIVINVQGRELRTDPIDVQVVRPSQQPGAAPSPTSPPVRRPSKPSAPSTSAPPAPGRPSAEGAQEPQPQGPDVFVNASIDKHKLFVNEQATLTVRFYTAVSLLGNPEYVPPETHGALSEDLPPERHGQTRLKGRLYNYSEIKTALFAVQAGKLTIGPATVRCQVQQDVAVDPFAPDFFQKFFSQGLLQGQTKELKTDPISLDIEELPAGGRPASFTGAVGRFRIHAGVDKTSAKVGDAITLSVSLEGAGNLKVLGAPKLPDLPSFRIYDTLIDLHLNKAGDVVQGSKVFKTVLVPRASGTLQIPPISFSYFSPEKGEYIQETTAPIDLEIAPAPGGQAPPVGFVSQSPTAGDVTPLNEDIRYIKDPSSPSTVSELLTAVARGFWVHLLPLAVFLFLGGNWLYQDRLSRDPVRFRFRQALPKALKKIRDAENQVQKDPAQSGAMLSDALSGFLADKLNSSASGLTLRQAQDLVRSRFPEAANGTLESLKTIWEELEQLRFAGGESMSPAALTSLIGQVQHLVKELEKGMRS